MAERGVDSRERERERANEIHREKDRLSDSEGVTRSRSLQRHVALYRAKFPALTGAMVCAFPGNSGRVRV